MVKRVTEQTKLRNGRKRDGKRASRKIYIVLSPNDEGTFDSDALSVYCRKKSLGYMTILARLWSSKNYPEASDVIYILSNDPIFSSDYEPRGRPMHGDAAPRRQPARLKKLKIKAKDINPKSVFSGEPQRGGGGACSKG